jgi:phosphate transport system permease protein
VAAEHTLPRASPATLGEARRRPGEPVFRLLVTGAALLLLVALGLIAVRTTWTAMPFLRGHLGGFLTGRTWAPGDQLYGALPFVAGTLVTAALALVVAVPVSVGIALFLNEIAPARLRGPLIYLVELLAAVPSVVYGLWGVVVLMPQLRLLWDRLAGALGFIPGFGGPAFGQSIATAAILLAIMIVPIITALSRETLALVPGGQREAAVGLGATRWEVMRHVLLPYARSGIVGAVVLGLGRAMGETIAVALVIGSSPLMPHSIFGPGYTMAAVIANEFPESTGDEIGALVAIGVLLFAITIVVNVLAQVFVRRSLRAIS